ncbi:ribonuclease R [Magnetospirillum gryphiswaldense]|uniref:ribonuclease R n=1 Tax=Magnetospirillum gryphiswaldense TaxID=55518 RepID=UPI000D0327EA|nr:ribonuclease R [Magnetospirillum gryphiswaldense]AVM74407.1 Ribonuclease R [Magnetospirillum gryphiswaldense MSR-1]AVM78310.1 Ribonuclease R [Magnetospirillum gryphiswaldense]
MTQPKRPKIKPVPSKQEVLEFIRSQPGHVGKRELARAFNLKGADKIMLKAVLKELEGEGSVQRGAKRSFAQPGALPDVSVVEITGADTDGELLARLVAWDQDGRPPRIYMAPWRKGELTVGVGDKVLAKLRRIRADAYEAKPIRIVGEARARVLGVYETMPDGSGRIHPTSRKERSDYIVPKGENGGAEPGELVMGDLLPGRLYGLRQVVVKERLGRMGAPKSVSLVAIHTNDIPFEFPADALTQAKKAGAATLEHRVDLRDLPLVTIDGEDARDFDDAVWAEPDPDPNNAGGWHCMVAIADVSWYVRPGDALDKEAFKRGNSVYFPDRVVPMLPEELSNGWCSLRPNEDRGCLAVRFWLDKDGNKLRHKFIRAMMRSAARLTYHQVQKARDGLTDDLTGPLAGPVIAPLYGAWAALLDARKRRGVLELDIPERKVDIDENGRVLGIKVRDRFDSHRLIEDFMIQANVCAAEELERVHKPCMYRIHDQPSLEKLDGLREFLRSMDLSLPKGQALRPAQLNQILEKVKDGPNEVLVNEVMLRSQAQAVYSPENIGHFGLGLARYAHFTSPIRRYADLLVHRALVSGLQLGEGGLPPDCVGQFPEWGEHISITERRAAVAEREAVDRYVTAFLSDRVGASFRAKVSGVTRFGLFVTLVDTGADGLIPIGTLPEDFYVHDEVHHCLVGKRTRKTFQLGQLLDVVLHEANALTGSMVFQLEGSTPRAATGPRRPPPRNRGRR